MERIASLIQQIQESHQQGAEPLHLLALVNRLQAELQQKISAVPQPTSSGRVAVVLPAAAPVQTSSSTLEEAPPVVPVSPVPVVVNFTEDEPQPPQEKIVEVLQVNESELEAELEEIRQKAEFSKQMQAKQSQMKPGILFDFEDEVIELPTLIHQPNYQPPVQEPKSEINETRTEQASLNERLKEDKLEIASKLSEAPIKDLKKAIGINDRFVFINELFRGDEAMYERSIKTINNFSIYAEAQYWMERELKIKLGWDDSRPATQEFYSLVKRRFS